MSMAKKVKTEPPPGFLPEAEQPYKVPENWSWVSIQTINQYNPASVEPMEFPDSMFELYSVPSSAADYPEIIEGKDIGSAKQSVSEGDVLLCKINPHLNRVWKVSHYTSYAAIASSEWIIVRNNGVNSDYLVYYFQSPCFRNYMQSNVSGIGGSLMRAKPKYVKTYPIPLPPLPEQRRIVDRIDSLFTKLDAARAAAQSVVDEYELRRDAILYRAFTGELTAGWREKNGIPDNSCLNFS